MSYAFEQPTLWQRVRPFFLSFDLPLLLALALLACAGLLTLFSAAQGYDGRFSDQTRNWMLALAVMLVVAQIKPSLLARLAVPTYVVGVLLLVAVDVAGETRKGATRWLNIGVTSIQPSELMKIAMPLMLAWWFQYRQGAVRALDFVAAGVLLAVPVGLIMLEPDLGTAMLVLASGLAVIFFAGLSWKLIVPPLVLAVAGLAVLGASEEHLCQPETDWVVLHEYQKHRVCTLLDPTSDPLGKGFHIIQSTIAIGSGGIQGKGYMQGTQAHLEFIPERTTDFIFAVYAEEFGLVGCGLLLLAFLFLIYRGFLIAANAPSLFSRLLAGAVSFMFFTYGFVNMGMVSGLLPVVGVPLPFMSYGGTALVTLGFGVGILMSIAKSRRLVQT